MTDKTTLLTFPCDFTLKIIGDNTPAFLAGIQTLIRKHYPGTQDAAMSAKQSKDNNYTAITATVMAVDKEGLDNLYRDLTKFPGIKMVL